MSEAPLTLPPGAVGVPCPNCQQQVPCYDPAQSRYFGCPACSAYFQFDPTAHPTWWGQAPQGQLLRQFDRRQWQGSVLPLGAVAVLEGYRFRLTGYQLRGEQADPAAQWGEYQLQPAELAAPDVASDFPVQLAEYQGHWLLIKPAHSHPAPLRAEWPTGTQWTNPATGTTFRLWHRYQVRVLSGQGEFDWNILADEHLRMQEMIAPPYLLTSEQLGAEAPAWYLAQHVEPTQVAAAFGLRPAQLPPRQGIGAAQPEPIKDSGHLNRLVGFALLVLALLQLVQLLRPSQEFTQQCPIVGSKSPVVSEWSDGTTQTQAAPPVASAPVADKLVVLPSFQVAGTTALRITFSAPSLTNGILVLPTSLVNDDTGQNIDFTRALEHYEGVEDGTAWAEGERSAQVLLSAIPAGRYHFNLTPHLEASTPDLTLTMRVRDNVTVWGNFWLALLALAIVPLWQRLRAFRFNNARWANSDYA